MDVEFLRNKYEDSYDGVITKTRFKIGIRHLQMVYMFLCSMTMGAMRSSNVVAVFTISDLTRTNDTYIQIHNWNNRIQGTIYWSFFFGYALIFLPAEIYLKALGDKFVITAVLLINGGLAAAMPTIVNKGGWTALCNAEFIMGMTQACVFPINQHLILSWFPPNERRICGSIVQGGTLLGIIIAFPLSGFLSSTNLGWELVFYSQAMLTLSMAAIWALLTAATPDSHQAISDSEKEFIKESLLCYKKKKLINPWRQILRTKQFWAIALTHCAANALFVFFLTEIPSLLFIAVPIKSSGWLSTLPFICMWGVYIMSAPAIDFVHNTGFASFFFDAKYYRKIVNDLATFGTVIGLMLLPNFITGWNQLGTFILMGTLGVLGLQFSGFVENHRDMTQNFQGTLLSMTSAVSNVVGALVPLITGLVIGDDRMDSHRWRIAYFILASFYIICNIIYNIFGSSERQDWDRCDDQKFGYINDVTGLEMEEINHPMKINPGTEKDTLV